ncbi:putative leucine-rich repeat-containing protein DDB_G0290503 [Clinocottus analis]|uniref:putative leucine-rich repeat-containing protein DDB_G0290503 n=1 Tax=Clinocottus analis TaxID=304258 RepID=UPI0035BF84DA
MAQNYLHTTLGDPEMEELHQIFSLEHLERENKSLKTQLRNTQTKLLRYNEELKNECEMRDTELYEARLLTEKAYAVQESEIRLLESDLNEAREEIIRVKRKLEEKESEPSNVNQMISQVAQLQSLNTQNQEEINSLKETVEGLAQSNNDKAAEIKHLKKTPNTKIQNLLATVQDSEQVKASLIEQNRLIADELGQSESDKNSLKAKNNNLQESNKKLIANKAKLESLHKKQHKDIGHLCLTVQDLHCKVRECHNTIRDQNAIIEQQKRQLKQSTEDFQETESLRNESMGNELAELQSQTTEQRQSICDLKEVVKQQKQANDQYLSEKKQLERATKEFQKKEHFLRLQNESMANELAELKSLTAKQQQSICNLKDQLKMRQEEQTLARRRNWRDKRCILGKNTESSENQRDGSLLVSTPEDPIDVTTLEDPIDVTTLEDPIDVTTLEDPIDVTTLEDHTDENTPVNPTAEVQARPGWYRCAKVILRLGVYVGVRVAVALLVTGAYHMITASNCFPLDGHYTILESFTSLHYITPPPF